MFIATTIVANFIENSHYYTYAFCFTNCAPPPIIKSFLHLMQVLLSLLELLVARLQ